MEICGLEAQLRADLNCLLPQQSGTKTMAKGQFFFVLLNFQKWEKFLKMKYYETCVY